MEDEAPPAQLPESIQMALLGVIRSLVNNDTVIIEAFEQTAIEEGSALYLESRKKLGKVGMIFLYFYFDKICDVFGPVTQPFYKIILDNKELTLQCIANSNIFYVPQFCKFIPAEQLIPSQQQQDPYASDDDLNDEDEDATAAGAVLPQQPRQARPAKRVSTSTFIIDDDDSGDEAQVYMPVNPTDDFVLPNMVVYRPDSPSKMDESSDDSN